MELAMIRPFKKRRCRLRSTAFVPRTLQKLDCLGFEEDSAFRARGSLPHASGSGSIYLSHRIYRRLDESTAAASHRISAISNRRRLASAVNRIGYPS